MRKNAGWAVATKPVRNKANKYNVMGRMWIAKGEETFLGYGRIVLLERIKEYGSITRAAKSMGMSYRHAWELVESMNRQAGAPLVETTTGGKGGGGAFLTPMGEKAISTFWEIYKEFNHYMAKMSKRIASIFAVLIFAFLFSGKFTYARTPVTLSPSLVILSGAKNLIFPLRVNSAKGLVTRFFANAQNDNDKGVHNKEIIVAAASDLNFAMNDIVKAFEASHKGTKVKVSYGSSGNFFAQISNGAPFDIFFSADTKYPELLEKNGLVISGTKTLYAIGRLVLWVPKDSTVDVEHLGINALAHPSIRKIAIANPQHAPYGRAAVAAMQNSGVYERVKNKLVLGENISQTAQFVQSGAADIGIVALSIALSPSMQEAGRYWEIPLDSYPLMEQSYVILRNGNNYETARIFADFFSGPEGRRILTEWGFRIADCGIRNAE